VELLHEAARSISEAESAIRVLRADSERDANAKREFLDHIGRMSADRAVLVAALEEAEAKLEAVEEDRNARRHSLAQEIHACLTSRGLHSPGTAVPADLICAVGRAIDGIFTRPDSRTGVFREPTDAAVDAAKAALVKHIAETSTFPR